MRESYKQSRECSHVVHVAASEHGNQVASKSQLHLRQKSSQAAAHLPRPSTTRAAFHETTSHDTNAARSSFLLLSYPTAHPSLAAIQL